MDAIYYFPRDSGWICTITSGAMFAGKTKKLFDILEMLEIQGRNVALFKPSVDTRNSNVTVHNGQSRTAITVNNPDEILDYVRANNIDCVAIDEAQMFDDSVCNRVCKMRNEGRIVIIAGLSLTSEGLIFGAMDKLLAVSDSIFYVYAVCNRCGNLATKTRPLFNKMSIIVPGGESMYEPLCNKCYAEAIATKEGIIGPKEKQNNE